MPPHRHPSGNSEAYHVISGKLDLYIFDLKGKIVNKILLEKYRNNSNKDFITELPQEIFGICQ